MSDSDAAEADALQRLEAALDRIAQVSRFQGMQTAPADPAPQVDTVAISARLDQLIGQLRDALSDDSNAIEA